MGSGLGLYRPDLLSHFVSLGNSLHRSSDLLLNPSDNLSYQTCHAFFVHKTCQTQR